MPVLLIRRRQLRGQPRAPRPVRHRIRRDLARAIRKDQTLPAAHGLDVSVAVVLRDRLQLRLRGDARRDAYDVQLRAGLRPTRRPATRRRAGGVSVFFRDGDRLFHTYSTYQRGLDLLLNTYNLLDLTPLGRQEADGIMQWLKYHDEY